MMIREYETTERTIKVQGSSLKPELQQYLIQTGVMKPSLLKPNEGYITTKMTFLRDSDFELVVSDTQFSENQRDEKFNKLVALNQLFPGVVPVQAFLENTNLDYSTKQMIIEQFMNVQQQQQQQAMLQQEQSNADNNLRQQDLNLKKAQALMSYNPPMTESKETISKTNKEV